MILLIFIFFSNIAIAQNNDIHTIYTDINGTQSSMLFKNNGSHFDLCDQDFFRIQKNENGDLHPNLTVGGDFNGDGVQETALFYDYCYIPNGKPKFFGSKIMMYGQQDHYICPTNVWLNSLKTNLDFNHIRFTASGDYNSDGKSDIALFWNDSADDSQKIVVLFSNGESFNEPKVFYSTMRDEFNFNAVKFLVAGDFSGDNKTDLAVVYDYFGDSPTTEQGIFIFQCKDNSFATPHAVFKCTKATFDFDYCLNTLAGDFNGDGTDDLICIRNNESQNLQSIDVFENIDKERFVTKNYLIPERNEFNFSHVKLISAGLVNSDHKSDLVMGYNHVGLNTQVLFVFESTGSSFLSHKNYFSIDKSEFSFDNITSLIIGKYDAKAKVTPTLWFDNHKGAITFGFDDGMTNALRFGASELSKNNLNGTFYVISNLPFNGEKDYCTWDTLRYYKNKGHEIASHTANHKFLANYNTPDSIQILRNLLLKSKTDIDNQLEQATISFSYPFGSFNSQTPTEVSNYFSNARTSQSGYNLSTPFDIHALKSLYIASTTDNNTIKSWFATAETYNYHLSLMYHNIQNQAFDKLNDEYSFALTDFRQNIADAKQANLWIDTQANIYKYSKERNALKTISYEVYSDSIRFVTDDFLDNAVYNQELTMRVEIPQTWVVDSVYTNRSSKKLAVFVANGRKYCFVNSVPDNSFIRVSKVNISNSISTHYTDISLFNCFRKDKNTIVVIPQNSSSEIYNLKFISTLGSVLYDKQLFLSSEIKLDIPDRNQWGILLITDNQNRIISRSRIR